MISTFLLLCVVTLIFYAFFSTIKPKKFPPGPVWYPFIGSSGILQRMTKKYGSEWRAFLELSRQYSTNVLGMKTSTELLVVVSGEKNVRQVFYDKDFDARPNNFFARLRCLGNQNMGITFANGEMWKIHRQFAVKNLKHVGYGKTLMETEIQNELSRLLNYLKENNSKPINVVNILSESVVNVLWKYVAGERIQEEKLKHLMDLFRQRGKAFSVAGGMLNQIPWCRYIIPKLSGYSLITKLNREISNIIEEAIEKHKNNEVKEKDFIYLFLEEINANRDPTFTEEQLKIVCLDFLIAGSQTSSNLLGFAFLKALKSQEIQQKIYEEIDTVIGDRLPCWNDSDRLIYTSAFLQEVHRYYPVVPMAGPRLLLNDTSIDGYIIPKGSTVVMSVGDIYFDPELWDDPHVFKPERFIDESGMLKTSEHMYTFGLGRRRCPGDSLAKSFIFITFVGIMQKYRIHVSNGTIPSDIPSIGILSSPRPYTAEFILRRNDNYELIDFILCEATIGIAYMCMDSFIKQYTRRYDCNQYMNPLLRGISYGRFLQTSLFIILHASYLADSLKFLAVSFREMPPWSICNTYNNTICMPTTEIIVRCNRNTTTDFITTSAYFNYIDEFGAIDRNTLTIRVFILGLVWILVFFFASVTEEAIVKIFKLSFMCRTLSTLFVFLFIVITTKNVATAALSEIVDISTPSELILSVKHVSYAYGIGFLGIHDFGAMSAFTMVDTATVIFVATFTVLAVMRSWIVKILFLVMKRCVDVDKQYGTHLLFYAILPLTTEFLHAHKLYVIYFYGNMMFGTLVYMTNHTYLLAKFLNYEVRSVKQIYLVGILCVLGFALSIPLLALMTEIHRLQSLTAGIDVAVLYLGGVYVAVVMWIYGLKKFCTDIQFWLNFRPTMFWKISWTLLPVALFSFAIQRVYLLAQWDHSLMKWSAVSWASGTFLIVTVMNIHAISGFLIRNNLAGVFRPHKNYGPPEVEDRKRRLYFSEFTRQRKCKHKFMVLDERFVCRHQRLIPEPTECLPSSSHDYRSSEQMSYNENTSTASQIDLSPLAPPS